MDQGEVGRDLHLIMYSLQNRELQRDLENERQKSEQTSFAQLVSLLCLQASEVERQLSMQVHALREDFREKNSSTTQHIIRLESLQAEVSCPYRVLGGGGAFLIRGAATGLIDKEPSELGNKSLL